MNVKLGQVLFVALVALWGIQCHPADSKSLENQSLNTTQKNDQNRIRSQKKMVEKDLQPEIQPEIPPPITPIDSGTGIKPEIPSPIDSGNGIQPEIPSPIDSGTGNNVNGVVPTGIPDPSKGFQCPVPYAVVPDPFNCEQFYICVDSQSTVLQCLPGLGFDPLKGYCRAKREVTACAISNLLDGVRCPSDGFQPNKLDCNQFYWCYQGSAASMRCPFDMHFDTNSKICLTKDMAKCASILDPLDPLVPGK